MLKGLSAVLATSSLPQGNGLLALCFAFFLKKSICPRLTEVMLVICETTFVSKLLFIRQIWGQEPEIPVTVPLVLLSKRLASPSA